MAFEDAGSEAGRIFLQLGRRTTTELERRETTIGAHGDDSRESMKDSPRGGEVRGKERRLKDSLGEVWMDESQCKWLGKDEQKVGVTERGGKPQTG